MAVQRAFLVIADIGGYTRFMNVHRVSLAHAQDIVARLLEVVIDAARPALVLSKLEGDAALFYSIQRRDDDRSFEAVSSSVVAIHRAFAQKRQELMDARLCNCDSCMQAGQLKLKFVTHIGEIFFQKVKRFKELAGVDVIVVHRLLKNSVPVAEYFLMTAPIADRIGADIRKHAHEQEEDLEGLGTTRTFYVDLSEIAGEIPPPRRRSFLRRLWELVKMNLRIVPFLVGAKKPCVEFSNMEEATGGLLPPPSRPLMALPTIPPPPTDAREGAPE